MCLYVVYFVGLYMIYDSDMAVFDIVECSIVASALWHDMLLLASELSEKKANNTVLVMSYTTRSSYMICLYTYYHI